MKACIFVLLFGVAIANGVAVPSSLKISVFEVSDASSRQSIGVNRILEQPVIAMINTKSCVVVYVLEHGLTSLVTNPGPIMRNMREALVENNNALIVNPVTMAADNVPALKQLRELPVIKVEIPEDTRVSNIATYSLQTMPIIMFFDGESFDSRRFSPVVNHGEIDIANLATPISV